MHGRKTQHSLTYLQPASYHKFPACDSDAVLYKSIICDPNCLWLSFCSGRCVRAMLWYTCIFCFAPSGPGAHSFVNRHVFNPCCRRRQTATHATFMQAQWMTGSKLICFLRRGRNVWHNNLWRYVVSTNSLPCMSFWMCPHTARMSLLQHWLTTPVHWFKQETTKNHYTKKTFGQTI